MTSKIFLNLVRWELEQQMRPSALVFLITSAIVGVLSYKSSTFFPERSYFNLFEGANVVFIILTIVVSAFFSRSIGGSLGNGEFKLLLSYPIKRWQIFFAKIISLFIIIFVVYSSAYSLHTYLDFVSIFDPLFFTVLLAFLLQIMLVVSVSVAISLLTKNEIMSMMASVLLLLGIDNIFSNPNYFSAQGRFMYLFQYIGGISRGVLPFGTEFVVTTNEVIISVLIPSGIFFGVLLCAYVYLTKFMEFD